MEAFVEKKYDVVALGELLIDFTDNGKSEQGNTIFEANPGGAPCNVLAMLTKLGKSCAFIGKVGDDVFGNKLVGILKEVGIDTTGLRVDKDVRTTLAIVENDEHGDRNFSFYRNPGADMMLTEDEIDPDFVSLAKVFHFGTLSMTHEGVRKATQKAIQIAKESGAILSFDPNLREPLWDSLDVAKEQVAYGMENCDILKISDNEIVWFTGEEDYAKGIQILQEKYQIPLILLSMGREGSRAYYQKDVVEVSAFLQENTIETTGAGDTFGACCINYVLEHGIDKLTKEQLEEMLTVANAAASIITTRRGALRVMPDEKEIEKLVNSR